MENDYYEKLMIILDAEKPYDTSFDEEFDPHGWSGGNFDDAYFLGMEHGRQQLADEIKELLK